jgi:hypothetical protein
MGWFKSPRRELAEIVCTALELESDEDKTGSFVYEVGMTQIRNTIASEYDKDKTCEYVLKVIGMLAKDSEFASKVLTLVRMKRGGEE